MAKNKTRRTLTVKQKAFADFYIETGNAAESARRAGYSPRTARGTGAENLTKPYILDYIKARNKEIENARIAKMKEVKEFWTKILRDDKTGMRNRLKASEFIAKTNGAFLEKVEHSGTVKLENPFAGLTTDELRQLIADENK